MDIQKYYPWNWVKDEDAQGAASFPARRALFASPFSLHREIDRLFDDALRHFDLPASAGGESTSALVLRPNVDIAESDKGYVVSVEVPGVDERDVKLELADNRLTISGEKKQEAEKKEKNFHRVERSYGMFKRVLTLPEDAAAESIEASYKHGVLTIFIPRKQASAKKPKLIEIKSAA